MPNHWHLCGAHAGQADTLAHDAGHTARPGALNGVAPAVRPLAVEDQVHRGCSSQERLDTQEPLCRVSRGKIGEADTGKRDYRHRARTGYV
jgi:hypothetical protein